jgi:hypothetical protein
MGDEAPALRVLTASASEGADRQHVRELDFLMTALIADERADQDLRVLIADRSRAQRAAEVAGARQVSVASAACPMRT